MLNSVGESCYEGVRLLSELALVAGTLEVSALCAAASVTSYASPRGEMSFQGQHLKQQIYIAEARGLDYDVLAAL